MPLTIVVILAVVVLSIVVLVTIPDPDIKVNRNFCHTNHVLKSSLTINNNDPCYTLVLLQPLQCFLQLRSSLLEIHTSVKKYLVDTSSIILCPFHGMKLTHKISNIKILPPEPPLCTVRSVIRSVLKQLLESTPCKIPTGTTGLIIAPKCIEALDTQYRVL